MPFENVVDTMLHELCHIVRGPHDTQFHALWNQLRDEYEGLLLKGYTGEGFLSQGRRLGGARIPQHEARRLAREAAEKRRRNSSRAGSGQRLGGAAPGLGQDIRKVIADAAERRNRTLRGCGTDKLDESQARSIAETATRNGFRTQAEEDEANEAAIAQAMWELVQEDEQAKYGSSYIPPSAENPAGNGGGSLLSSTERTNRTVPGPTSSVQHHNDRSELPDEKIWECEVCTLHNPSTFLCCDACGVERPEKVSLKQAASGRSRSPKEAKERVTIDLTQSPTRRQTEQPPQREAEPQAPPIWYCRFCGTEMERQWWTCSTCGKMKDNSR